MRTENRVKRGVVAARKPLRDETTEQRIARLEREIAALREENESLRADCEILRKAAAVFVKEDE